MTIRSALRPVGRTLPLLAAVVVVGCKSPPPSTEPMYAGEARTKTVTRRTIERVQPAPLNARGAIVAPEDCGDSFGDAIAVKGSLVVVGAPKAGAAGKAWIYDAEHLDRAPVCLVPPPGVTGERFGASVSISPAMDRILVGAPFAEVGGVAEMGRLYLWKRNGDAWQFERAFTDTDPQKGPERLGRSVIVDDTCVIAGAPNASMEIRDDYEVPVKKVATGDRLEGPDTGTPTRTESRLRGRFENEGAVLIWNHKDDGSWSGPNYALLPRGRPGARFGSVLARHTEELTAHDDPTDKDFTFLRDSLVVSAPPQRTKNAVEGGTVSIFVRKRGEPWRSNARAVLAPQRAQSGDLFGSSIAMGDGILVAGIPLGNLAVAVDAGEVAVFQQNVESQSWNELEPSLTSPMVEIGSRFGASVAVMGQLILAGQPGATRPDGLGRAFVFRKYEEATKNDSVNPSSSWKPIAELVAPPFLKARGFGSTMAASDEWVAVGASGAGGSGCVALFRVDREASGIAAPKASETPTSPAADTTKPAATAAKPPTSPPPVPSRDAALAPATPGALKAGGARPGPLPKTAEPAVLYETPPETPAAKPGQVPADSKRDVSKAPPESPYETPPETPGTKP